MIPSIPTAVCSNSGYPSDKKQKFFFLKGAGVGGGREYRYVPEMQHIQPHYKRS